MAGNGRKLGERNFPANDEIRALELPVLHCWTRKVADTTGVQVPPPTPVLSRSYIEVASFPSASSVALLGLCPGCLKEYRSTAASGISEFRSLRTGT